jgi:5-methylcytosine-specific restriction endonuclease McrA
MNKLNTKFGLIWIDEIFEREEEAFELFGISILDSDDFQEMKEYEDSDLEFLFDNWIDVRAAWYKIIKQIKFKNQSQTFAWEDFHSVNLGGPEFVCITCGVIYFDNYAICGEDYQGSINYYKGNCSEFCKKNMIQFCIVCGEEYKPHETKKKSEEIGWSGTCSTTCLTISNDIKKKINIDKKYLSQVKRRIDNYSFTNEIDFTVTRSSVFEKYKGVCNDCGVETNFYFNSNNRLIFATVDHVIPLSKGGNHTWKNVQLLCQHCNSTKKNKL